MGIPAIAGSVLGYLALKRKPNVSVSSPAAPVNLSSSLAASEKNLQQGTDQAKKKAMAMAGMMGTVKTSGMGVTEMSNVTKKTLLGQ